MGAKQFRGALSSAGDNDENGKRKSKVGEGDRHEEVGECCFACKTAPLFRMCHIG